MFGGVRSTSVVCEFSYYNLYQKMGQLKKKANRGPTKYYYTWLQICYYFSSFIRILWKLCGRHAAATDRCIRSTANVTFSCPFLTSQTSMVMFKYKHS